MTSLHYLLMRSHSLLNRRILEEAAELGLSPGQPKVLEYLRLHGTQNQRSIADYCRIEPATVGSILTRMEEAGLVERRQQPGDDFPPSRARPAVRPLRDRRQRLPRHGRTQR